MFPPQLLPLILSAIVGYSRPIILSQEGTVTLSGVVQTIVKEGAVNGMTLSFKKLANVKTFILKIGQC